MSIEILVLRFEIADANPEQSNIERASGSERLEHSNIEP
jgi:hypothetical protein